MTALARVRRTRLGLAVTLGAAALAWSAALIPAVLLLAALMDTVRAIPHGVRAAAWPLALVAGAIASAAILWRGRTVRSDEEVALWIEARRPDLRYALVTAVDPLYAEGLPALESVVRAVEWRGVLHRAALRAIGVPALLALAGLAGLSALPAGTVGRVTAPRPGDVLDRPAGDVAGDTALVVTVRAPAYAGGRERTYENPAAVSGLAGSGVTVQGRGRPPEAVLLEDAALPLRLEEGRWRAVTAMPVRPALIRVRRAGSERLVALESVLDSVPRIELASPRRDTVLRVPEGTVSLEATASDDHGLGSGWFEYIVSSGSGESFAFRSGRLGESDLAGTQGALAAGLDLTAMALRPGDVVHLRALARDANTVTGPGEGVSETRTIRVARPDEYDTTAVVALPPTAADTSLLSQRMLIDLAEALVERLPRLDREIVVAESEGLARDQAALRRRVADVIFMRLGADAEGEHAHGGDEETGGEEDMTPAGLLEAAEAAVEAGVGEALDFHGDETPVLAINRPLLEAYNAMWDAGRELGIADPAAALPHMYAALEAIQRARTAERIYLRGRPPPVVVDLARVRLAGDVDQAAPGGRTGLPPSPRLAFARRFDRLFAPPVSGLADSLLVLRLHVLDLDAALAAALGEAAAAVRGGGDATDALIRTRRLLGPPARRLDGLPAWSGAWMP